MLKNVKSVYILRKTFSYMVEKRILFLISYNKSLQYKLEKSLINFKKVSRKYIIYETSNRGIIYDVYDNKIFEREFLNGKRNGKGKEYYNELGLSLIFEGEYLNEKRNGKGKEYNENGILKFEREYSNDEKKEKEKEKNIIMIKL